MRSIPWIVACFCSTFAGAGPPAAEVAGAEPRSAAERPAWLREMDRLLEQGLSGGRAEFAAVELGFQTLGRVRPQDPRIDYAWGLVLLKRLKHREAAEQFRIAATAGGRFYLPAGRERLRMLLLLRDGEALLDELAELAIAVRKASPAWTSDVERSEAARLLGQVVGFLRLPEVDLVDPDSARRRDELNARMFREDFTLLNAYRAGRCAMERQYAELAAELDEERAEAKLAGQQQTEVLLGEIDERRGELQKQTQDVTLTREEWQHWLDDELQRSEKELGLLRNDYQALDAAAREVSSLIATLQLDINRLQFQQQFADRRRLSDDLQFNVSILQTQHEILKQQARFSALQQQSQAVTVRATRVVSRKSAAERRYEQATGELARRDSTLQKWAESLEKSATKLSDKAGAEPRSARSLARRLTLPGTYFDLDFEAEKERILQSYTTEAAP